MPKSEITELSDAKARERANRAVTNLKPHIRHALDVIAEAEGKTPATVMRELIIDGLKRRGITPRKALVDWHAAEAVRLSEMAAAEEPDDAAE